MLNSFCCISRLDRLAREALNMDLLTAYAVRMTFRGSVPNSNARDNLWGWCDRLFAGLNPDDNRGFPRTDQVPKQEVEPNSPNKWHWLLMIPLLVVSLPLLGQVGDQSESADAPPKRTVDEQQAPSDVSAARPSDPGWQYGGFLDFDYLKDFNDPANHLFPKPRYHFPRE
jgi:hypothetical protein